MRFAFGRALNLESDIGLGAVRGRPVQRPAEAIRDALLLADMSEACGIVMGEIRKHVGNKKVARARIARKVERLEEKREYGLAAALLTAWGRDGGH